MKRVLSVLLLISLVASFAACSQQAGPTETPVSTQAASQNTVVVTFADPMLEKMVRTAMNKPEGDITLAEAEAITELKLNIDWQQEPAPNTQIKDISGLENFKNLKILELHFHAITDISPLAGLTKLTSLSLGGNPVADITPLSGLANLGSLTLFNCQAQDYTPLANLTGLGMLLLDHSTISDVSMLSGLTELWWLSLANTQVSDVSPLSTLTNLRKLQLAGCPISDYSSLSAIYPNLEEADFSIVASLRALGFIVNDSAPEVEGYKTEEMYVLVNRVEWGERENKDEENAVLLCKNPGTENEITVIYYPDEKRFLVLSHQKDFRYTFDYKNEEMNVEYGEEKASAFIEEAYDEVDPYLLLTPIKDFDRVMTDTFGVSANTLFTLPRETETVQSPEQPAASENSLIGLGFGFDDAGTCGVYEQHEPHYMSVAIHRPEWGEWNSDWNIEFMDEVNGYSLRITYHADEGKYHISVDKNNAGAAFDYFPATGKYTGEYPDLDTVKRMFNAAFGTQGDGFYGKPLAYFEQLAQERFGMSVDKLYALPKQ